MKKLLSIALMLAAVPALAGDEAKGPETLVAIRIKEATLAKVLDELSAQVKVNFILTMEGEQALPERRRIE